MFVHADRKWHAPLEIAVIDKMLLRGLHDAILDRLADILIVLAYHASSTSTPEIIICRIRMNSSYDTLTAIRPHRGNLNHSTDQIERRYVSHDPPEARHAS